MTDLPTLIARLEAAPEGSRERFMAKCRHRPNGCVIWIGAVRGSRQKRGCFWDGKKNVDAARWMLTYTTRLPTNNECACHTCDNPLCVNPDHLFWATHQENVADMMAKERSHHHTKPYVQRQAITRANETMRRELNRRARGERHGRAKLTARQVEFIRQDPRSTKYIAADYGVHRTTIQRIRSGKRW